MGHIVQDNLSELEIDFFFFFLQKQLGTKKILTNFAKGSIIDI